MHWVTSLNYEGGYRLRLGFEDGSIRRVNLEAHLDGEVFESLKDPAVFRTARLEPDIDTVVWSNGADISPDFLYDVGEQIEPPRKVAEEQDEYGAERKGNGRNGRVNGMKRT